MTDRRKWYRWPEGYRQNFVPWFVVLRRLLFWPLLLAGKSMIFVAVAGGYVLRAALWEWRK